MCFDTRVLITHSRWCVSRWVLFLSGCNEGHFRSTLLWDREGLLIKALAFDNGLYSIRFDRNRTHSQLVPVVCMPWIPLSWGWGEVTSSCSGMSQTKISAKCQKPEKKQYKLIDIWRFPNSSIYVRLYSYSGANAWRYRSSFHKPRYHRIN